MCKNAVAAWRQMGLMLVEKFTRMMPRNSCLLITPYSSLMNVQMKMPLLNFDPNKKNAVKCECMEWIFKSVDSTMQFLEEH